MKKAIEKIKKLKELKDVEVKNTKLMQRVFNLEQRLQLGNFSLGDEAACRALLDNGEKKRKMDVKPSDLKFADQGQLSPSQVNLPNDIDGKITMGLENMTDCHAQASESQVQSKNKTKKKRLRK